MSWDMTEEFTPAQDPDVLDVSNPKPGHYVGITDEDYFAANAINNSSLSLIHESVSDFVQFHKAEKDPEKLKEFDFGTAAHMAVLQPERFTKEYLVKPKFNLRTNKGKADSEAWDEYHSDAPFVVTENEMRKIEFMKNSIMADPRASYWLSQDGVAESAVFWKDPDTGLLCKLKADWLVETPEIIVCLDFKTTDTITKFQKDFFRLRYDVQDCHYSTGLAEHFKKPVLFLFLACSKTIDLGRYPTWCGQVEEADKHIAREVWAHDMNKIAEAINNDDWIEYNSIARSAAAREWHYANVN